VSNDEVKNVGALQPCALQALMFRLAQRYFLCVLCKVHKTSTQRESCLFARILIPRNYSSDFDEIWYCEITLNLISLHTVQL